MICYIEEVIVPFLKKKREQINVAEDQSALAIFDCLKDNLLIKFVNVWETTTFNLYYYL